MLTYFALFHHLPFPLLIKKLCQRKWEGKKSVEKCDNLHHQGDVQTMIADCPIFRFVGRLASDGFTMLLSWHNLGTALICLAWYHPCQLLYTHSILHRHVASRVPLSSEIGYHTSTYCNILWNYHKKVKRQLMRNEKIVLPTIRPMSKHVFYVMKIKN